MTIKREEQLLKKGIDPGLYEMLESKSEKQYRIDVKNLVASMTALLEKEKQTKKRLRRFAKSKTQKAAVKKK